MQLIMKLYPSKFIMWAKYVYTHVFILYVCMYVCAYVYRDMEVYMYVHHLVDT